MPQFLILAMETKGMFAKYSGAEMRAIEKRYYAWTMALGKKRVLQGGNQLIDRRFIEMKSKKHAVREAKSKEASPGGYWLVKARNMAEAVKLCEDCPHFDYGGAVQVLQGSR